MKKAASWILGAVLALALVVAFNAGRARSVQIAVPPSAAMPVDAALAAAHLAGALQFQTVASATDPAFNADQFTQLHAWMARTYPLLHAALQREQVGRHALLFTWQGSEPHAPAIGLMAHQDVVPVAPGTADQWLAGPFSGTIRDGFVWGRGAWDNKGNLVAQMEAVELLLAHGFKPRNTLYLIMGDDEEVGGQRGARLIAALLKERGVRLAYLLDEGLLITEGMLPGIGQPVALVGVAEKGYVSYRLHLDGMPGHASMPPRETVIGAVSAALVRLENTPAPAAIGGVSAAMFDTLAPEMTGLPRILMSNQWLFKPLLERQLATTPSTNALLRTTAALTIFSAGERDNVLPDQANATVNFRLIPGDTVAATAARIRRTIGNDRIAISALAGASEPSRISATDSPAYRSINASLRSVFPGVVVAPGLMIAATDARHFTGVADNIYRFSPVRAGAADLARFHGLNERLSVANLAEAVQFYQRLIAYGEPAPK